MLNAQHRFTAGALQGAAINSGVTITTVEGIAKSGKLSKLQETLISAGGVQCGFCTPGMVLTAHAFLLKNPEPTRKEARQSIKGNLCRCTGYQQIIDAIMLAAEHYQV